MNDVLSRLQIIDTDQNCKSKASEFARQGELHSNEETSSNGSTPTPAVAPATVRPKNLFFFGRMPQPYDLDDLLSASAEVLGKGTYGTTYKAEMESGSVIAVKRLRQNSLPERAYRDKVAAIGRIDHHNVVPLQSYYFSMDEKLMVYEYVTMGCLSSMLHDGGRTLAEHGIAHLFDPEAVEHSSGVGYHAPEVEGDPRKLSHKSDVYSFGVLLLELLTGEMPTPNEDLPLWVRWSMVEEEWTSKLFDDELLGQPGAEEGMMEMLKLALDCTADLPDKRPAMLEILGRLAEQTF
ncbi:hypothetical protein PR202_gb20512 [Eleusine coracana subsp. coracana]|uniref:Protein kinase domain-containing protein n=1 Tax=Eleusine coracana subsp. coracana TaxID=191504 RepID=A0AAV5FCR1_ELECO|nr:hypothetical protein PR202_gb20512 [Eleusine coracana subsp. coracana]